MANKYRVATGNWDATNSWALSDGGTDYTTVPTSSDNAYFTALTPTGTHTVNVTANTLDFDCTGFTGTLAGSSVLNIYGNITLGVGMTHSHTGAKNFLSTTGTKTITSNGKTMLGSIVFNGIGGTFQLIDDIIIGNGTGTANLTLTNGTFDPNGKNVSLTGFNQTISGNFNFYNLTHTGGAIKTGTLIFTTNISVTNILTINGNSSVNRVLISSNTKGTPRTITAWTVSITNADFQDITGAGAGSWDLSAITGLSGDCGGNSGITFTTPTTTDCSSGTTWSTSTWSVRVPLPQDTATFSGSSRTITQDMPRIGSVNFTGSSGLTWTTSTTCSFFGSINLTNLGTLTASTQAYTYEGRGNSTLTSAGKTWTKSLTINAPGGKIVLGDNLTVDQARTITLTAGELDSAGFSISTGDFVCSGSATRTLTLSSSIITATATSGVVFSFSSTGLTITSNTATFKHNASLTGNQTFGTGGVNFNGATLWNATTNAFNFILTGSGTFGTYKSDANRSLKFTAGTTTTATNWDIGSGCTIGSVTTATHTLAKAGGGTVAVPTATISYSTASPISTFYATSGSTDSGNNTNWIFGEIPVASSFIPRVIWF